MPQASGSVFQALASRARTMSDPALVMMEAAGFVAVLVVVALTPKNFTLALPFIAVSMFGLWGVADHFRSSGRAFRSFEASLAISIFQVIVAVIGTVAAAAILYGLAGRAIGTVVS